MNGTNLGDVVFCSTCIFWQAVHRDDKGNPIGGICRRNPPTPLVVYGQDILGKASMQIMSQFPPTAPGEYCGEHADSVDEADGGD